MAISTISKKFMWLGIVLLLVTGAIHLIDAPSSFDDATYKGLLFVANGIGAAVAALGISRGSRSWGWGLGLAVAGGALIGYIISRVTGLPGLEPDVWLEPLGVVSLLVEGAYLWLAVKALSGQRAPRRSLLRSKEQA